MRERIRKLYTRGPRITSGIERDEEEKRPQKHLSDDFLGFNSWQFINIGEGFACPLLSRHNDWIFEALHFTSFLASQFVEV